MDYDWDDDEHIILNYRLPRSIIFDLIDILDDDVGLRTARTRAIPTSLQAMIALRFLATGSLYASLAESSGVSKSSVCRIVRRFAAAISSRVHDYVYLDVSKLSETSNGFCAISDFPSVLGCVDGSQFAIKSPSTNEVAYVNRKGFHSINTQLVCDDELIFTDIVVRYPGSTNDAFIFQFCALHRRLQGHELHSGWLLGDSGYPNLPYLLTPIGNPICPKERRYNRAHRRTRVKIECAIDVLKARFLCLSRKVSGPLLFFPDVACQVIACCCYLHNIARRRGLPDPENIEVEEGRKLRQPEE